MKLLLLVALSIAACGAAPLAEESAVPSADSKSKRDAELVYSYGDFLTGSHGLLISGKSEKGKRDAVQRQDGEGVEQVVVTDAPLAGPAVVEAVDAPLSGPEEQETEEESDQNLAGGWHKTTTRKPKTTTKKHHRTTTKKHRTTTKKHRTTTKKPRTTTKKPRTTTKKPRTTTKKPRTTTKPPCPTTKKPCHHHHKPCRPGAAGPQEAEAEGVTESVVSLSSLEEGILSELNPSGQLSGQESEEQSAEEVVTPIEEVVKPIEEIIEPEDISAISKRGANAPSSGLLNLFKW